MCYKICLQKQSEQDFSKHLHKKKSSRCKLNTVNYEDKHGPVVNVSSIVSARRWLSYRDAGSILTVPSVRSCVVTVFFP